MVKIEAIIKPEKQEDVQKSLVDIGVQGMTVFDVRGFGRQKGQTETYRGTEIPVNFLHKVMITIVIKDELLDEAIEAIRKAALTGNIGDGKIFVTAVDRVVRIRTGETGPQAL